MGFDGRTRQYSGIWLHEFEGSTFVEGATAVPKKRPSYKETDWLEYRLDQPGLSRLIEQAEHDDNQDCYIVQPFLVTFIGHRTQRPFGVGHMGLWRSQVTVHRTISIKRAGPSFCYDS